MQNSKKRKFYSIRMVDAMFLILIVAGITLVVKEPRAIVMETPLIGPWGQAGLAILLTAIVTAGAAFGAKFDKRCAEDYIFQLMSNAAFLAIPATLFAHAVWDFRLFNNGGMPQPTSGDIVGVLLLSWSMGYFFYRIKGVNQ